MESKNSIYILKCSSKSFYVVILFHSGLSLSAWHCPTRHWKTPQRSHLSYCRLHSLQKCQADKVSSSMFSDPNYGEVIVRMSWQKGAGVSDWIFFFVHREQKDPVYLRDKVSQKHSKEQFESAQKIEQEYSKFFTGLFVIKFSLQIIKIFPNNVPLFLFIYFFLQFMFYISNMIYDISAFNKSLLFPQVLSKAAPSNIFALRSSL